MRDLLPSLVGLEGILCALDLCGNCRVDTWENATARRIAIFTYPIRVGLAWQRKGLCVAHVVSELCRVTVSTLSRSLLDGLHAKLNGNLACGWTAHFKLFTD